AYTRKNFRLKIIAATLAQAAILGAFISGIYKAFTGRAHPTFLNATHLTDTTHVFKFGLFRGGVFWGWPSSHTTVAFAMATALVALFPRNKTVKILSLLYSLYVGLAVSASIHWFSDFVAGVIIGSVIGAVVGRSLRERLNSLEKRT
ncbi:phosphatase PAP2 family protein, partial [Candidatus Parcubacteria bacterium]|nr:phosphatase PAP2 family protein [Candidatus Parcubacteria bacterium]